MVTQQRWTKVDKMSTPFPLQSSSSWRFNILILTNFYIHTIRKPVGERKSDRQVDILSTFVHLGLQT